MSAEISERHVPLYAVSTTPVYQIHRHEHLFDRCARHAFEKVAYGARNDLATSTGAAAVDEDAERSSGRALAAWLNMAGGVGGTDELQLAHRTYSQHEGLYALRADSLRLMEPAPNLDTAFLEQQAWWMSSPTEANLAEAAARRPTELAPSEDVTALRVARLSFERYEESVTDSISNSGSDYEESAVVNVDRSFEGVGCVARYSSPSDSESDCDHH